MSDRPYHQMRTSPRRGRFLNEALAGIAATRGLRYEERSGGWLVRVGDGKRQLALYGVQISLNSAVGVALAKDKAACAALLADAGLPTVPTHLVLRPDQQRWLDGRHTVGALDDALAGLDSPAVVKPNTGSSGVDVTLCSTATEARAAALSLLGRRTAVAVQPRLDLVAEERWIVLDGTPVLRYSKHPVGGPLFNLSLGAMAKLVGVDEGPAEARDLAVRAAAVLGLRIASVDLVWTASGGPVVLEINTGMSFEHFARQSHEAELAAVAVYDAAVTAALRPEPQRA